MCTNQLLRVAWLPTLVVVALAVPMSSARICRAGILLPQQVTFDASDLERTLSDEKTSGAASSPQNGQQSPPRDRDKRTDPLRLLESSLPTGQSSSSSSSSTSGATGSSAAVCLLSSTIAINDDLSSSRLAEDRGLFLPDPPGTDLLRPPRSLN